MGHPDIDRVNELLARIHFACRTRRVADPETQRALSSHQASILDHLDEQDATTLSDLAALMGVTASTMSLAIRRLVAEGYVDRLRDPDDGRRVNLRLTQSGARMKEAKSIFDPERVAALLGVLSPGERKNALEGLSLLSRAASDLTKARRPDSRTTPAAAAGAEQLEE